MMSGRVQNSLPKCSYEGFRMVKKKPDSGQQVRASVQTSVDEEALDLLIMAFQR